ncbi:hypothetical protein [Salinicoccus halodurans]|uniref:Uncharacterized protein n=1 Tax=Salinicoccus halodurans TaxID=407035 RepID=A0AA94HIA4_9STAP|nr:hypothetical protein [Salinicoccus halodurans]SFK94862.1 hypothetical protein SAMN05216235_2688 [Salinicoccus halodurans]
MELDKKDRKRMHSLHVDIQNNNDLLSKSDWLISKRQKRKLTEKNNKIETELNEFRIKYDDPEIDKKAYHATVENSNWTKAGNAADSIGKSMQSTGKKITKVGMHTTGAVWSPLIYAGYQGVKHARKKPKNETPEQDLIELIKEVEAAHRDGKIDEEQKRSYVLDFVDNYYRK